LSLCVAPFTITAGLLDWQYYYGGKWPVPIIMKLIFAVLLLVVAGYATHFSFKEENKMSKTLFLYAISAVLVISLGYFGGDLVYGTKVAPTESADTQPDSADSQIDGAHLFDNNCSQCHYLDKQDVKTGPSLQGLFKMDKLPVSGFPVSDETVYKQIKTPYKNMPAFDKLTEEEIREIIDYLKTV
jgi:cytochrome c1